MALSSSSYEAELVHLCHFYWSQALLVSICPCCCPFRGSMAKLSKKVLFHCFEIQTKDGGGGVGFFNSYKPAELNFIEQREGPFLAKGFLPVK